MIQLDMWSRSQKKNTLRLSVLSGIRLHPKYCDCTILLLTTLHMILYKNFQLFSTTSSKGQS